MEDLLCAAAWMNPNDTKIPRPPSPASIWFRGEGGAARLRHGTPAASTSPEIYLDIYQFGSDKGRMRKQRGSETESWEGFLLF